MAFPAPRRRLVGLVYAFCRITDDIVDEADSDSADVNRRLTCWLRDARQAYRGESEQDGWLRDLMAASRSADVPFTIIEDLVAGVGRDVTPPSFETWEELKAYCYGVASTVGLWLCHLHGVRDPWMLDRAAALGRAMQITNIVRDVGEDLGRGRLYLPTEVLRRHGLRSEDLEHARADGYVPDGYEAVMREMIETADREYRRAWEAIPLLPRGFAAPAALAADVYRGIQREVEKNDWDNLTRRAKTSLPTKVSLAVKAWLRLHKEKLLLRFGRGPVLAGLITLASVGVTPAPAMAASAGVDGETLGALRGLYVDSVQRREAIDEAEAVIAELSAAERSDALVRAFAGAFEVVKAKHVFWPFSKLKHVKRGLPLLDAAVQERPKDVEIRFLRFVTCYHLPGLVGRKATVRADLSVLSQLLPGARATFPDDWYRRMVGFVLGSRDLSPQARADLQAVFADLNRTSSTDERASR